MSSFYSTFATAEDDYRRERAAEGLRGSRVRLHHASRVGQWRDRRRTTRRDRAI